MVRVVIVCAMRGLTHRWEPRSELGQAMADVPDLEPLVRRFLHARGLPGKTEAQAFAEPRMTDLHDPSEMGGVDIAAKRLLDALSRGERIVVYGDYDVDGVCGSVIIKRMLTAIQPGADVRVYIPHRLSEGYGINPGAIEQLADDGATLVISVDCGITAHEPARVARSRGVDLIITDHHNPSHEHDAVPPALCVVHPRCSSEDVLYPNPDICGAGVAFKVAWRAATMHAGSERVTKDMRAVLLDLLSLAALGTVADVVSLTGENRIIARHGLVRLGACGIPGIHALIDECKLGGSKIDAEHVGFQIAPRLNAAGRMGHADDALRLLLTDDHDEALTVARRLASLNDERRKLEQRIADEATDMAEASGMTGPDQRAIVLAHESWHAGVIGIVCSRLVGRFHRPTLLMTREGGVCKGSGRSIDGFNLHAGLQACAEHLETFGGHDMAAGLSLQEPALQAFGDAFIEYANERVTDEMLTPTLRIDCEADIDELTPLAVRQLAQLGPFGQGNPRPSVLVRGIEVSEDASTFGARAAHASIRVCRQRATMRLVAWGWGERAPAIRARDTIDVVVRPKLNDWRGRVSVEPEVRDVRVHIESDDSV